MSIGLPLTLGGVGINEDLSAAVSYLNLTNQVTNGKAQVEITWGNPASNFGGVAIVRKEGSAPTHFTDGVRVYDGTGTSCIDPDVEVGKTYFYRAFPYNGRRQVQTISAVQKITPNLGIKLETLPVHTMVLLPENGKSYCYFKTTGNTLLREMSVCTMTMTSAGRSDSEMVQNHLTGWMGHVFPATMNYKFTFTMSNEFQALGDGIGIGKKQALHEALYGSTLTNLTNQRYYVWNTSADVWGTQRSSDYNSNDLMAVSSGVSLAIRPMIVLWSLLNATPDKNGHYSLL